jgi:hypothetical protein
MVTLPTVTPSCPALRGCSWTEHGRKHFPHRGLTKGHTRHGPAKYLPGATPAQIHAIESATVSVAALGASATSNNTEYARETDQVVGWDEGEEATVSFAECSGGTNAGRSFHGRPMTASNHKLRGGVLRDE